MFSLTAVAALERDRRGLFLHPNTKDPPLLMIRDSLNYIFNLKSKQSNVQPCVKSSFTHFKWKPVRSKHAGMMQFKKLHTLQIWSKPYANLLCKLKQKVNTWTTGAHKLSAEAIYVCKSSLYPFPCLTLLNQARWLRACSYFQEQPWVRHLKYSWLGWIVKQLLLGHRGTKAHVSLAEN